MISLARKLFEDACNVWGVLIKIPAETQDPNDRVLIYEDETLNITYSIDIADTMDEETALALLNQVGRAVLGLEEL